MYQYQNPFQPYQQYQPAIPQQMMAQQAQQMPKVGIAGRMVKSVDEIAPSEVPMDGSVAFFPAQDGKVIYAKGWNTDGTISTIEYAAVNPKADESVEAPTLFDIMDQLSDIQDLLKAANKPARKTTAKKGDSDDASD